MLSNFVRLLGIDSNIGELKEEIDNLPDIGHRDTDGLSILHWLVKIKDIPIIILEEIIDYILLRGLSIDITNSILETPLIQACRTNKEDIAFLLVKKGANINDYDEVNDNALLWASYHGNLNLVRMLIENGANINHRYRDGKNALMWACKRGKHDIVNYLLQFTININDVDNQGKTAYQLCSNEDTDRVFKKWILDNKLNVLSSLKTNLCDKNLGEKQLIGIIFSYYTEPILERIFAKQTENRVDNGDFDSNN